MSLLDRILGKKGTHEIKPKKQTVLSQTEMTEPTLPLASNPELDFLQNVIDAFTQYVVQEAIRLAISDGRKSMSIEDIKKILERPININID